MLENPRRGRQARNFTTNASKILHLKSSSEQIFSRKLPLGAPAQCLAVVELQSSQLSTAVARRLKPYTCIFFSEHFLYNALKTFPVTQFRSSERRKLHFRESNFTNLPRGGGACSRTSWTTSSGTSKCYRKPCKRFASFFFFFNDNSHYILPFKLDQAPTKEVFNSGLIPRKFQAICQLSLVKHFHDIR